MTKPSTVNSTRREFVQAGLTFGAMLALPAALRGATAAARPKGLLFDDTDVARIRATLTRPEFAAAWKQFLEADAADDDKILSRPADPARINPELAQVATIMFRAAFAYRITGEARHRDVALRAYQRVMEYPRWDWILDAHGKTVGVMRNGTTTVSAALTVEWLGSALTEKEQLAFRIRLANDAGPAAYRAVFGMTHPDKTHGWVMDPVTTFDHVNVEDWPTILDHTNLRIVATSALVTAGCLLRGLYHEAPQWISLARDSLRRFAGYQPKDGSFDEGASYWTFTFSNYIYALEVLQRTAGLNDRGLLPFQAMARYTLDMRMPTVGNPSDAIDIGDVGTSAEATGLAWIARTYRDPVAQFQVLQPDAVRTNSFMNSALAAIWFDPSVKAALPAGFPLDHRYDLGEVVSRTGFETDDSVLAFRSGHGTNHEHADRNSVLFKAHGERLINDPLHASYSTKDPKWLLRQTPAHSAVLIDGHGHFYHDGSKGTNSTPASATLQDYHLGSGWMLATSDALDAYQRAQLPVKRVQRTVFFLKPDILLILDRVNLTEARPIQIRFQAFNDDGAGHVAAEKKTFTLSRPTAALRAESWAAGEITVAASQLPLPAASGLYPFAEIASRAALDHTVLTACSAARVGAEPIRFHCSQSDPTKWQLVGILADRSTRIALDFSSDLPAIKID